MAVWDLYRELERLRGEMDRVFESGAPGRGWSLGFLPGTGARQYPRINLAETAEDYTVEALAPGVDPESLDLQVKESLLTLSGEKRAPQGVRPEAFHRSERAAGRFVRTFELPGEIDAAKVRATYTDGILRVVLPKAPAAKPKQIEIQVQ